jgi:hypothetical protein
MGPSCFCCVSLMSATVGQLFERCLFGVLAVHGEQYLVCLPEYRGCKSHCIQNVCRRINAPPRRSVLLLNIILRSMFLPGRLNNVRSISHCSWVRSSKQVGTHLSCLCGRCFNPLLKKEQGRI